MDKPCGSPTLDGDEAPFYDAGTPELSPVWQEQTLQRTKSMYAIDLMSPDYSGEVDVSKMTTAERLHSKERFNRIMQAQENGKSITPSLSTATPRKRGQGEEGRAHPSP